MNLRKLCTTSLFGTLLLFADFAFAQDAPQENQGSGESKIFAGLDLFLTLIDQGNAQPNSSPALDAQFGYAWSATKLGFWGSSRRFAGDDDYLKYSIFGSYKIFFSTDTSMDLRLDVNQLTMSKLAYHADIDLWGYIVFYDMQNNWMGKGSNRSEIGVRTSYDIFWDLKWPVSVSTINNPNPGIEDYFSIHTGLGYELSRELSINLMARFTTSSVKYNIDGFPTLYLNIAGKF